MNRQSRAWSGAKAAKASGGIRPQIHRMPPHNIEAEQGVLGSILVSPHNAIPECVGKITPEFFYVPAHRTIYDELVDLWKKGAPIDLITFTNHLRDKNLLESIGGAASVTNLFTFVPTSANIEYYLDIVRDKYIAREAIAVGTEIVRRAYEEQDDVPALVDEAASRIATVQSLGRDGTTLGVSLMDFADMDPEMFERDSLLGNRFLCGRAGMLFVGPTGVGKSSSGAQQDTCWGAGREAFGIHPARPLKILCIQAENDDGDLHEMARGVCDYIDLTHEERELARRTLDLKDDP